MYWYDMKWILVQKEFLLQNLDSLNSTWLDPFGTQLFNMTLPKSSQLDLIWFHLTLFLPKLTQVNLSRPYGTQLFNMTWPKSSQLNATQPNLTKLNPNLLKSAQCFNLTWPNFTLIYSIQCSPNLTQLGLAWLNVTLFCNLTQPKSTQLDLI